MQLRHTHILYRHKTVMVGKEDKRSTVGDGNGLKTVILPSLKYISLLSTIVLTPVIIGMPSFEYWHLVPIWGGGGLTTIIVWQRTQTTISPEEAILKHENKRIQYMLFVQLAALMFVVVLIGGVILMSLILVNPDILDKFFDFVLELVR